MSENEGEVRLGISVDLSSIEKSADKAAKSINQKMKKSFLDPSGAIIGVFKKIAVASAGAFSIRKIGEFGAKCLELGSDLAEVQNVVDVTFPNMGGQIDKFAKNAVNSFGLSETMAKKFTGTFGSMAEAFGFSEKEAAGMATTLTGLAGDVASFYNISQDEAYTKLKSVFSGETETLKDLGIVMTQTALDSYALANGYGKVTSKMSEAEKVSLRYAFVQDQLKNASGDFARTSDSWANQVRILSLQFDSLRATLGQGLINIFTPIIKKINVLMGGLTSLAAHFKAFTELITGKKSQTGSGGVGETAEAAATATESLDSATDSANNLSNATTAAGKSAQKAAKKMLGLMGFDELNNISSSKDKDPSEGSGSGTGNSVDYGSLADGDNVLDKTGESFTKLSGKIQAVITKFKELATAFKSGFQIGLGNTGTVFASIKSELASIKDSFKSIVSDTGLRQSVSRWCTTLTTAFGQVLGSIASIGLTIADNLLGGISKYLEQHKKDITSDLTALFDVKSQTASIVGKFSTVIADIATVFRSDEAKQITADIINIFADSALNIRLLIAKLGRDIINFLTQPIVDNKDKIKEAMVNAIKPLSTVIHSISTTVSQTWDKIQALYDEHIKPLIDSLANGISGWMGTFLDGYNQYIAPVLEKLSKRFKEVMEGKVKPAIDSAIGTLGEMCDTVKVLWEKWIQPFVNWCIKNIVPKLAKAFETAGNIIIDAIGNISDIIKGISKAFSGICTVIKGIAQGDWKTVWEGVKQIFSAVWDAIKECFSRAWNAIKLIFSPSATFFKEIWNKIKEVFSDVATWFNSKFTSAYNKVTAAFSNIKTYFSGKWADVKSALTSIPSWFHSKFASAYSKATNAFSNVKNYFKNVWENIKSPFSGIASWFKDKFSDAWEKVKDVFSTGGKIFTGIKEGIAGTFRTVVNGLIEGINKIIDVPFNAINGMLNKIRDVGVGKAKPFSGLWEKNPIKTPQIPKLASGGYVKKNTPQLAMIGDNRHQGEVVAPEDKLQALLDSALKRSGEVTATALIPVIERLCNAIIELEQNGGGYSNLVPVSDTGLYRIMQAEKIKEDKRHGKKRW